MMRCVKITRGKVIHNLDVRWIVFVEQMNAGTELCDCFLNVMKGVQMFMFTMTHDIDVCVNKSLQQQLICMNPARAE